VANRRPLVISATAGVAAEEISDTDTLFAVLFASQTVEVNRLYLGELDTILLADNNALNIGTAAYMRMLASGATRTINGIAGGASGRFVVITNAATVNGNTIILANQSTSASAADRIVAPAEANFVLLPGEGATIIYDSLSSRWRVVSLQAPCPVTSTLGYSHF
jgi:hypothetical protein